MSKKIRSIALYCAVALTRALGFVACNDEDEMSRGKVEVVNSPKKLQLTELQIDRISYNLRAGVSGEYLRDALADTNKIVICTLWKKNDRNYCCRFGICQWFPKKHFNLTELPERTVPCIIDKQEDGSLRPLIVELKEDVSRYPEEVYAFEVTEDIDIDDDAVRRIGLHRVIIKAGSYRYNSEIGEFGGYEIPLYGE